MDHAKHPERRAPDDEGQAEALGAAEHAGTLPKEDRRLSPAVVQEATVLAEQIAPAIAKLPDPVVRSRWDRFLEIMGF